MIVERLARAVIVGLVWYGMAHLMQVLGLAGPHLADAFAADPYLEIRFAVVAAIVAF